jgi:archaellum biogenesis ATPase FlaH
MHPARPERLGDCPLSLVTTSLASCSPEPLRWLWPGRIPLGKVTLIAGDPGLGKSFITLDLAARVSSGAAMPDGSSSDAGKGEALLLNAEDDPADTLAPRLRAMGADLSDVHFVARVRAMDGSDHPENGLISLDRHCGAILQTLERRQRVRLIVIDPLSAYLGDLSENRNAEARFLMTTLGRIAAAFGVAIVCVTHLNKSKGERAVYRTMGSLGFVAAARMAHLVTKHPHDDERRIFAIVKSNLSAPAPALSYSLTPDDAGDVRLVWDKTPVRYDADALETAEGVDEADALGEACEWLASALANGPVASRDLLRLAEQDGHSARTLRRAKQRLRVGARKTEGASSEWVWVLPDGRADLFAGADEPDPKKTKRPSTKKRGPRGSRGIKVAKHGV